MKVFAVLVLIAVIAVAMMGMTAGNLAVDRYYDQQAQPAGVLDTVLASRQTPPVAPEPPNRWGIILVPIVVMLAAGIAIGLLFYGERFLKQWRMLTKKGKPRPASYLPVQTQAEWNQLSGVRPVTPLPAPQERSHEPY